MSDTTSAIEKFMSRYHYAVKAKSKEMRLDLEFAAELSSSIAVLLSKNTELYEQVIETQEQLIAKQKSFNKAPPVIPNITAIDSGGFK